MLRPKKLLRMARKWRRQAAKSASAVADKGHFVVYTVDHSRFEIPLHYLNNNIFRELLKTSEDEFGLPTNTPITLPCDSSLMNYLVRVFERALTKELGRYSLQLLQIDALRSINEEKIGNKCWFMVSNYAAHLVLT